MPGAVKQGLVCKINECPGVIQDEQCLPLPQVERTLFQGLEHAFRAGSARSRSWTSAARCLAGVARSMIRGWGRAASARAPPEALTASQPQRSTRHVVRITSSLCAGSAPLQAGCSTGCEAPGQTRTAPHPVRKPSPGGKRGCTTSPSAAYFLSDSQERLPSTISKLPLPSPLQSQARPG